MAQISNRPAPARSTSTEYNDEHLFDKPDFEDPALSPAQRIALVDRFGKEETQQLQKYSDELFTIALRYILRPEDKGNAARGSLMASGKTTDPSTHETPCQAQGYRIPNDSIIPFLNSILSSVPMQTSEQNSSHSAVGFPISEIRSSSDEGSSHAFPSTGDMQWESNPSTTNMSGLQFYDSTNDISSGLTLPLLAGHHLPTATNSSSGTPNNTVFSGTPSSGGANTYTTLKLDSLAQREAALQLARSALQDDPRISDAVLKEGIWTNAGRHQIFMYFFGPNKPNNVFSPFGLSRGKRALASPEQWQVLVESYLQGSRTPGATATQWSLMEDQLVAIMVKFTETTQDPLPVVLERIYALVNLYGLGGIPSFEMDTRSLLAWIDGGDSSWLSLVYPSAQTNSSITKRLRHFDQKTIRRKNAQSAKSSGSIVDAGLFVAPSIRGSVSTSAKAPEAPPVANNAQTAKPAFDISLPQFTELAREVEATNKAQRDLAHSKAAYLRIQAQVTASKMLRDLLEHDQVVLDRRLQRVLSTLDSDKLSDCVRSTAERILEEILTATVQPIDYASIIEQIGNRLPSISEIADVFYNAQALRAGAFEAYQSEHATMMAEDASMAANEQAQAGPSSATNV